MSVWMSSHSHHDSLFTSMSKLPLGDSFYGGTFLSRKTHSLQKENSKSFQFSSKNSNPRECLRKFPGLLDFGKNKLYISFFYKVRNLATVSRPRYHERYPIWLYDLYYVTTPIACRFSLLGTDGSLKTSTSLYMDL